MDEVNLTVKNGLKHQLRLRGIAVLPQHDEPLLLILPLQRNDNVTLRFLLSEEFSKLEAD